MKEAKTRFERIGWDTIDGCWIWKGYKDRDGYGSFRMGRGFCTTAHRAAYSIYVGDPQGMVVRHKCDNPSCVNVNHLELGSIQDNVTDSVNRGRRPPQRGERNHASKLTKSQVEEIRTRYSTEKISQARLADEYGVSQVMVSRIVRRANWVD